MTFSARYDRAPLGFETIVGALARTKIFIRNSVMPVVHVDDPINDAIDDV
jgi:hypothetical protein